MLDEVDFRDCVIAREELRLKIAEGCLGRLSGLAVGVGHVIP
jgi:hypothetical protein